MKTFLVFCSTPLLLFWLCGIAGAFTISYDWVSTPDGNGYTSPYSGVTVETFDAASLRWTWSGVGRLVLCTVTPPRVSGTKFCGAVVTGWLSPGKGAGTCCPALGEPLPPESESPGTPVPAGEPAPG